MIRNIFLDFDEIFLVQTWLGDEESIIVAGGLGGGGEAVSSVEHLNLRVKEEWRTLGHLMMPRFSFPTVGRILGEFFEGIVHEYTRVNRHRAI